MAAEQQKTEVAERVRRSPKAASTRAALIEAAIEIFDGVGFHDATISQISAAAGKSHGSFYTYFQSKEEVFRAAIRQLNINEMNRESAEPRASEPEERIAENNARFFEVYRHHARTLAAFEELAARDEATQKLRRVARSAYFDKTIASIQRWQREGLVDPDLDAEATAHCLGSMVERVAQMRHVFGDGCEDSRMMVAISDAWCGALGLRKAVGRRAALELIDTTAS